MVLIVVTSLLALACGGRAQSAPEEAWTTADSVVTVASSPFVIRAAAWRDFMPSVPSRPDGSDLMISVQIVSLDSTPMPAGARVDSAWVRSNGELWATEPSREPRPDVPHGIDVMLRGGPRWGPAVTADVLVRLRLPSGHAVWLQRRAVPIARVS